MWEVKPRGKVVLKFLMPGEREGSQSPTARKTRGKSHCYQRLCGIRSKHQLPSALSQLEQPPSHWEQRDNTLQGMGETLRAGDRGREQGLQA